VQIMKNTFVVATAIAGGQSLSSAAFAEVNPFTETFSSSAANWSSSTVFTPLNYPASGGPDGSAYGSANVSFAAAAVGDQPLFFRGQNNFGSSGGAFIGNWVAFGVNQLTLQVRHNAGVPVDFFVRLAPAGGPGVVADIFAPVPSGEWTTLTIPVTPSTSFLYETMNPFDPVQFTTFFSNIARIQVGAFVDASLAGRAEAVTFDIDNVAIVPAPGAGALLGLALLGASRRRR
jgi:hypothetical protein